jgi:hypothetical protein
MKVVGISIGIALNIFFTLQLKNRITRLEVDNLIIKDHLQKLNMNSNKKN